MKASSVDRVLSKAKLEERLGPFEPPKEERAAERRARTRYKAKPVTRHPLQSALWNRYLQRKRLPGTKRGILGTAFPTWKEFLYADALNDPLAMVLIIAHREALNAVFRPRRRAVAASSPVGAGLFRRLWMPGPGPRERRSKHGRGRP